MNVGDNAVEEIWREYPVGTWTLRASVPYGTNELIDTIDICNAFISYEIIIPNAAGCSSTSNNPGANLSDIINPYIPVIDWVTVDTTNDFVDISWNQNAASDTYGYVIYGLIGGFWVPLDTVWGINITTYEYPGTTSDIAPESFRVTAFDSCFTSSVPPTYQTSALSNPHTTIHVTDELEICERNINLAWTPYEGWDEGIDRYEIIVSIGGSPFEVIGSVGGDEYAYSHLDLIYDVTYCYFIRAVSNNDSISYSNRICRYVARPSQASFHYLATATHTLGNEIEVVCYTDGASSVNSYEVEVRPPGDTYFSLAAIVPPTGTNWVNYLDADVSPQKGAYEYQVHLIDSCGNIGLSSEVVRTIFLEVNVDPVKMLNVLSWSSYIGFDGDIVEYKVYRGENGIFSPTPIATTLPGVRSFVDDVSAFMKSEGEFCYRVEAIESTNSYGFEETAFSNTVCAVMEPIVYIPNAFIVNGENPIFLPIVSLYEFDSYELNIYNRWGEIIFNTQDKDLGWDGRGNDGDMKSEGTYVYLVTFQDREGNDYVFRGTVNMLIDRE